MAPVPRHAEILKRPFTLTGGLIIEMFFSFASTIAYRHFRDILTVRRRQAPCELCSKKRTKIVNLETVLIFKKVTRPKGRFAITFARSCKNLAFTFSFFYLIA